MAKQLADRELLKGIKTVGRNPNDENTFGKSLDGEGKPYVITSDMRKVLMRKAINELVDTPIPVPEQPTEEAGATKEVSENVRTLEDKVQASNEKIQKLTEMVEKLTGKIAEGTVVKSEPAPAAPNAPSMSFTREVLLDMCKDAGISVNETITKEEMVNLLSQSKAV